MINVLNSNIDEFRTAALNPGIALDNSYWVMRVDDGAGGSAVAKATGTAGEDVVGISHVSPLAATQRANEESVTTIVGGNTTTSAPTQLGYTGIDVTSFQVFSVTANALLTVTTDYAVTAGGLITWIDSGVTATAPAPGDVVEITYLRSVTLEELAREGLPLDYTNQINGADGAVEFATGDTVVEVDFFDAGFNYAVGGKVYSTLTGMVSGATLGDALGTVAQVPTAENPVLGVSFDLNF